MEDHDPDVSLNFYSYDFKSNNVEKKRVKVVNERKKGTVKRQGDSLILTTSGVTGCSNFKDGLVARRIDGKLMIVGALIQNSCETKEKGGWEVYESVAYHSIHFCELAGLCPPEVKVNSASCLLEFLVISFTFLSFYAQ
uniref:Uncharacterized protein n=1 Tax=Caenorhabditis japonica TaxID=281687 RepID=A0A8R1ERB8_CAEJA